MPKTLTKITGPDDPRFGAAHLGNISGSRIASICGVDKYRTPSHAYLAIRGELADQEESEAMHFGKILEPVVAREFEARTGLKTRRVNAVLQHDKYPNFIASLDRLVVSPKAVLELKTGGYHAAKDWDDGEIPPAYEVQCRWYMLVTGLREAFAAAILGGQRYVQVHLERDAEVEDYLIEIALNFLKLVHDGTPPDPDGSAQCTALMKQLFPVATHEAVALKEEARQVVAELRQAKAMLKTYEEEVASRENWLKAQLGNAELGYLPGSAFPAVKWSNVETKRLNTKRLESEYPQIADLLREPSVSRRFSLTKGEE